MPCFRMCNWLPNFFRMRQYMELAVFFTASKPNTQNNVYIQAGNSPQNLLLSSLNPGFVPLMIWPCWTDSSNNFWLQTFPCLVMEMQAWMEYLRSDPVGVAMLFCLWLKCFIFDLLFSDMVWVVLGHRDSWSFSDSSCNKFLWKQGHEIF